MKNLFTFCFLIATAFCGVAQTTITLQPDGTTGKDAMIDSKRNTANFGSYDVVPYWAWTNSGSNTTGRSLLDFDLSSVPANATILSATLTLYSVNHAAEGSNSTLSGTNEGYVQRITSSWSESTVNWDNQPTSTTANQGVLASSNDYNDVLTSDVKSLVSDYVKNPTTSFGFLTCLQNETAYRRIVVASSDNTDATKRPKLQVTYKIITSTDTCVVIRRNAAEGGFDGVMVDNNRATTNFGGYDVIPYWTWTNSSNTTIGRSYLRFPLTSIPANAVITSSTLKLSSVNHAAEGSNSQLSGTNDGTANRVTDNWSESTVTWNNKPNFTTTNAAAINASSDASEVFNIDVKNLVKDMIANPTTSFGFMLKLNTEQFYRRIVVASSDNTNTALRPSLEVCYAKTTGINSDNDNKARLSVFPNPATKKFSVVINSNRDQLVNFSIIDINGKKIMDEKLNIFNGNNLLDYDTNQLHLAAGVYSIIINNNNMNEVQKLIIY